MGTFPWVSWRASDRSRRIAVFIVAPPCGGATMPHVGGHRQDGEARGLTLSFLGRTWHGKFESKGDAPGGDGEQRPGGVSGAPAGGPVKAFNPVARCDPQHFVALISGEHSGHGFANRALRTTLTGHLREDPTQQSAQISRLLAPPPRLRAGGEDPPLAASASPRLAIRSWAPRSDSATSTSPCSTPRRREERREFHRTKQRTNDGRIYAHGTAPVPVSRRHSTAGLLRSVF